MAIATGEHLKLFKLAAGLLAVSRTAKGNLSLLAAIATPGSFSQETRLVGECSPALTARAATVSFSTNS